MEDASPRLWFRKQLVRKAADEETIGHERASVSNLEFNHSILVVVVVVVKARSEANLAA
jgi:hypothetical protein